MMIKSADTHMRHSVSMIKDKAMYTYGCGMVAFVETVAADALMLKHRAINGAYSI